MDNNSLSLQKIIYMPSKGKIPEQQNLIKKKYQPPKEIRPEHQEFLLNLGMKLQKLRNIESISALAKKVGISRNAYSQMEQGKVYFNLFNLMLVLTYHKKSASDFFKEDETL